MMRQQRIDQKASAGRVQQGLKMGRIFTFRGLEKRAGNLLTSRRKIQVIFLINLSNSSKIFSTPSIAYQALSLPLNVGKAQTGILSAKFCRHTLHHLLTIL